MYGFCGSVYVKTTGVSELQLGSEMKTQRKK